MASRSGDRGVPVLPDAHDLPGARDVEPSASQMNVRHVGGDSVHKHGVVHLLKAVVKVFEVQEPHVRAYVDGVRAVGEARPEKPPGSLRGRTFVAELHEDAIFEKVIVERAVHVLVAEQEVRRRQSVIRVSRDVGSVRTEVPELHQSVVVESADEKDAVGVYQRRLIPDHGKVGRDNGLTKSNGV